MKTIILLILIVGFQNFVLAQESMKLTTTKRVWIKELGTSRILTGDLLEVKDSSLILLQKPFKEEIFYNRIESIKIRKKSSIVMGALYGTLSGILLGAIIGYAGGDDPHNLIFSMTAEEKAGVGAVMGAIGGASIGILLGTKSGKIQINGYLINFQGNKERIMK
jgi:hypothetical protein